MATPPTLARRQLFMVICASFLMRRTPIPVAGSKWYKFVQANPNRVLKGASLRPALMVNRTPTGLLALIQRYGNGG